VRSGPGRARLWAALVVLGAGGCAGRCGREASGAGPLSESERRAPPGVIAFLSERAGQKDVWLVKPDGTETQLTRGEEDEYPGPPSPDGRSLLVIASGEVGGLIFQQLRVQPLAGGPSVPLHKPRPRARNASWGPNGAWLVAESDVQGFSDVVRLEPREGVPELRLTEVREGCFEPAVSPDGTQVAFVSSGEGDPEIFVMKLDGTDVRRLTTFYMEDFEPRWSPDGKWLSFFSSREQGRERLFIVRPDGTELRAVSGAAPTGDEREAVWSPDSTKLAFVGRPKDPNAGKARIWVASVAGGDAGPLTDGKQVDDQPAWSPDGKHLVFVSERGVDADLYLMRADGSGQTRLTTSKGADWLPRWFVRR